MSATEITDPTLAACQAIRDVDKQVQTELLRLRHELEEAQREIARHHRDFEAIRKITDTAMDTCYSGNNTQDAVNALDALRQIRGVVG